MRCGVPLLVAILTGFAGPLAAQNAPAGAETPAGDATRPPADAAAALAAAREMLDGGRLEDAETWLRSQVEAFPDSGPLQILLGVAQLRRAQPLWAIDTFARRVEQDPADCEARTWLGWAWMEFAAVEEILAVLDEGSCADRDPWAARVELLRAVAARAEGDDQAARSALDRARARSTAFAGDRDALRALLRSVVPDRLDEVAWRLDLAAGYTSNPLIGSPADPTRPAFDPASPMLTLDTWLRLSPDFDFWLRPALELTPKLQAYFLEDVVGESWLDLSARAGAYLDWDVPRVLLAYRLSYLLLADDPGPGSGSVWYASAHRGEVEAELTPWLMIFAGAGRRQFYEMGRTRTEVDGGLGGTTGLADTLFLLWTATARGYWANDPAYDAGGISASLNLQYRRPEGWSSRGSLTLAGDWYPDSAGAAAFGSPGSARADLFFRGGFAIITPAFAGGLRLGFHYDFSRRNSTLDAYDSDDHRVLLKLTWAGSADLTGPSLAETRPTAEIDWGFDAGESALVDRVQDLLRQEEQVYRSCGCAE